MSVPRRTTLVDAEALAARLRGGDGLVVLDCRASLADPGAGQRAHARSHLPGALYADLGRDLSGLPAPGAGRHPWPDDDAFARRVGEWGITPEHQVVAYDDGDGAFAARAWWLLRALGHGPVAVLDGGWSRWTSLHLPTDQAVAPVAARAPYPGRFDRTRLLGPDAVAAGLRQGRLLLDARATPRFRGEVEPIDRVAGHVPGARNRPYGDNLVEGRFKDPALLRQEFEALLDGRPPAAAMVMCGSGVTACHHLLAMAHAGLDGAALATGSWSGWIDDPARPVATGAA